MSEEISVCACMRMGVCVCGWCLSVKDDYVILLKGQSRSHHRTIKGRQIHKNETPPATPAQQTTCPHAEHIHRYCTQTQSIYKWDPCRVHTHTYCTPNEPSATLHLANNTLDCHITVPGINTNQPAGKLKCHVRFSITRHNLFPFKQWSTCRTSSFSALKLNQQQRIYCTVPSTVPPCALLFYPNTVLEMISVLKQLILVLHLRRYV